MRPPQCSEREPILEPDQGCQKLHSVAESGKPIASAHAGKPSDSARLDACWGYIVFLALCRQQPFQQRRVHDASEPYLAVDRHDRNLVAVLRHQLGIGVDIHLGDLETVAPLKVLEQIECLVATTALHASVDGERQMLGACSGAENACE